MKRGILLFLTFMIFALNVNAQSFEDFDIFIRVKSTPLKDQQSSGTCWSFATSSFLETEALRLGKDSISISPIYYVHPTYLAKAEKYIAEGGKTYFDSGDLTFSVIDAYRDFGALPESVYSGIIDGDWQHDHLEMDNLLFAMVESIGTSGYGRIKPQSWKQSVESVLNAYLGIPPAVFSYENKLYSPQSFAREYIGINPDDYIEFTSYLDSDFYEMFELEIPANWNNKRYQNLPINDFEQVIDYALNNGFSLAWDGDATEPGFDFEAGIAKLNQEQEAIKITQELRQSTFEDKSTTDDHNMHIIGKARDKTGKIFYVLKNSEGMNKMNGYIFMSKNALLLKTISLLVHRDGIPKEIREKCNFE